MATQPFVTEVSPDIAPKLQSDLMGQGFEISTPPYTCFAAKKKGLSCTLYQSGKLVVQGKHTADFIEFYLEPEVLQSFNFRYEELELDTTPRIGIDEAGKGDFFGPLCIGGLFASEQEVKELKKMGVKDSKAMTDKLILKLAKEIRANFKHSIVRIGMPRYNEMYDKFKNLNSMLAWGHATAIEELVEKSGCRTVIIDQFAKEHVVETALKRKEVQVDLTQRTKGESDVVVAGASMLARAAFVEELDRMGQRLGMELPKGASPKVIEAGRQIARRHGPEALKSLGKMHFKTLDSILSGL